MLSHNALRQPLQTLTAVFAAWKVFLLAIVLGSAIGPTYDTSSSLVLSARGDNQSAPSPVARLTSWDAIYFTQVARRGYMFEQEWAFGSGLPLVISCLTKG